MKPISLATALFVLSLAGLSTARASGSEDDGVALAIIYDTSGSMKDPVPDESGHKSAKYLIANRALLDVTRQIEALATNNSAGGAPRKLNTGLFIFQGERAREAVKFGPFDAVALREWALHFSHPDGNTPLGNTLAVAGRTVLKSPLARKHVLVITDGMNTVGPEPARVLPSLQKQAAQSGTSLSVHFVAFDVAAKVFAPVKRLGATVVAAENEAQLNSQLQFILQRKILLEEEEPPKTK